MTESFTLQFDSARSVQELFANDITLLKELERALDVKVTTRDGWLRIEGDARPAGLARRVFEELNEARGKGVVIQREQFAYALKGVAGPQDASLGRLADCKIVCSSKRPPIMPKSPGQMEYIRLIQENDMVFGIGPAGTGKTYLAMACAVAALRKEQVNRIILTRPAVEAGQALGFLPGDLKEKIFPYLRPLYDALHDMIDAEEIEKFIERGVIEIAPLAYMRGRTLNHAFVILDEAQNTTTEQMFMFLTRLGVDSRAVITGDRTQIDLPSHKKSGLVEAVQALHEVPGIAFNDFDERDVVRHELVQSIVKAYRRHRSDGASTN
jgi:phosphate starvation-inducible protein PhoH and related proteins